MLYRFPPLFYVSIPNPCAPLGDGENLSNGDIAGLKHLYPHIPAEIEEINSRQSKLQESISNAPNLAPESKELYLKLK
jgi:hypothetical protein